MSLTIKLLQMTAECTLKIVVNWSAFDKFFGQEG